MLAMENKEAETEEEHAEKALALLMERVQEEKLRQKAGNRRVRKPVFSVDRKREFTINVLNYLAVNKGEPFDPNRWTYTSKNGEQKTVVKYDLNEVVSCSSEDSELIDYRKQNTGKRIKKDKRTLPLTLNDEELYPNVRSLIERGRIRRARTGG
jgi:hypothetical protein